MIHFCYLFDKFTLKKLAFQESTKLNFTLEPNRETTSFVERLLVSRHSKQQINLETTHVYR